MMTRAVISGLGTYAPAKILTNHDLERIVDTNDEWILTRTGIRERHIAGPDESTTDMAVEASKLALAEAGISGDQLDFIIVATNTPDTLFPSTAARLQSQLTAVPVPGFDLQAGCTGLIYALAMGSGLIQSGVYRKILVVGADKLSSITDYQDRTTAVLFGDAAGAMVLEADTETEYGILGSYLKADGRCGDLLSLPAGGSRLPASENTVRERQHFLKMNGNETFRFAVKAMPEAVEEGLKAAGLTLDAMDLLVPHQANLRIIDAATRRFNLDPDRVVVNIERYGNTSVATIPLALEDARRDGRLRPGHIVVLVAFGAGLTWGSNVIRWGR